MVEAHYAEAITATPETDMVFTDVVFFSKYMVCELLLIALNLTIGMNTN